MTLLKKTYYSIIKGVSEIKTAVFISERTQIISNIIKRASEVKTAVFTSKRTKIIRRVSILNLWLFMPLFVLAKLESPLKSKTFGELINKIADVIVAIGIPVAAVFIVYAGFLFVSARGSEEQITKAKTMLYWTIIGTMLVIGAKVIAEALQSTVLSL